MFMVAVNCNAIAEAAVIFFELLMMGGVSPETC
jgi:hypothetical protein